MAIIYDNKVKGMGDCVAEFEDSGMFILFGENAPDTLKDYCYSIDVTPIAEEIKAGHKAVIDGKEYVITAVGDVVMQNLGNLGHVTFSFTGETEAELPGTIYLEQNTVPKLEIGSTIQIITA